MSLDCVPFTSIRVENPLSTLWNIGVFLCYFCCLSEKLICNFSLYCLDHFAQCLFSSLSSSLVPRLHHCLCLFVPRLCLSIPLSLYPSISLYPSLFPHTHSGGLALQTIGSLSGGQKSRVALAAITFKQPHLLIMDEPTVCGDQQQFF